MGEAQNLIPELVLLLGLCAFSASIVSILNGLLGKPRSIRVRLVLVLNFFIGLAVLVDALLLLLRILDVWSIKFEVLLWVLGIAVGLMIIGYLTSYVTALWTKS